MHIPFVSMVKFQFLEQFPVDHLSHPVVSNLVLFSCYLAAFDCYAIDHFVFHDSIVVQRKFSVIKHYFFI